MDTLAEFGLDFDALDQCLDIWLKVSGESNEDLAAKRQAMDTLVSHLEAAGVSCRDALKSVDDQLLALNSQASSDAKNYDDLTISSDKNLNTAAADREQKVVAASQQLKACSEKHEALQKFVGASRDKLDKANAGLFTNDTSAHEELRLLGASSDGTHHEVASALQTAAGSLGEKGEESGHNLDQHAGALAQHAHDAIPTALNKVTGWIQAEVLQLHSSTINGAVGVAGQVFQHLSTAIAQTVQSGGHAVESAINQAVQDCQQADQKLSNRVSSNSSKLLEKIGTRQKSTSEAFDAGAKNAVACSKELAELKHKYEIIKSNV